MEVAKARILVSGDAEGEVLATSVPLSFWGGLNPDTGEIVDQHHPLRGKNLANRVLVMPFGRGSCSASGVLLQALFTRHAPAAIILRQVDEVVALGPIVADEMFGRQLPVLVLDDEEYFTKALEASSIRLHSTGRVDILGKD